jgi:hypothetical protein
MGFIDMGVSGMGDVEEKGCCVICWLATNSFTTAPSFAQ